MKRSWQTMVVAAFVLLVAPLCGQTVNLRVETDKVLHSIDEKIYGHFLEHIYNSCNGGLWGELVWDRSFEDSQASKWRLRDDGVVVQRGAAPDQRLVFGQPDWSDYEFTVEAKKTGGAEGFLILFRVKSDAEFYWANLGGWGNKRHGIERRLAGQDRQGTVGATKDGTIASDKWYSIKVRCEGNKSEVFLDGEKILEHEDARGHKTGQIGIGTWETLAEFRNFKVTALDGKTLFEGAPEVSQTARGSKHWKSFGTATATLEQGDARSVDASSGAARNGEFYQKIVIERGAGGIMQNGFSIREDEEYLVSFWYKCDSPPDVTQKVALAFFSPTKDSGINILLDTTEAIWKKAEGTIRGRNADNASLGILVSPYKQNQRVTLCIDQVSVMPKSWLEKFGGMRPDLLEAIAALRPPTIRWPGGCFASAYRWKSGIGSQDDRVAYPFSIWDDRDVNSFGTDEFLDLCRRVGAEPIIVVNAGTPGWNANRNPDLADHDWAQEAADWIEYCNGPADSTWGKVRAANGHAEPYNVKYWEIDNETQGGVTVDEYIILIRKMATAMKKADPSIKLAVAGSHYAPRLPWDQPIIEQVGDLIDYISFHQYDDPNRFADGPAKIGDYFRELQRVIAASNNPNIKIFDSEWNAQSTDWRTGLYAGGLLNEFERCADILEIGGPALFLRHTSATAWDNAFVNFDSSGWFPAPNYVVMKLWRDHYAPHLVQVSGETHGLNVVATKSEDGKTVVVKAVNPQTTPRDVVLTLSSFPIGSASCERVVAESLSSRNTLKNPHNIAVTEAAVDVNGDTVRLTIPPLSASVVLVNTGAATVAAQSENPIIWADVPDIAIIRVGDMYYMSSTTMHMSPGLPIMKSKNLVDWEISSYAYDTLADTDGLSLRNGKSEYGAGSWASSFRYHDGTFYVSTFAGSTGKTHIYTTRDIEKGEWQHKSFSPALHDHSLFFDDDGKVYMVHGVTNLRLTELNPDLSGIKPGGFDDVIVKNIGFVASPQKDWGEGSQLFKVDGNYYYLCNITWPDMRTQVIHRAAKITGPYEGRVMLHDSGIAQGGLIDTPNGEWFAYLFQDCGAVGRVPFLVPLVWKDGWPVLGNDGKVPMRIGITKESRGLGNIVASDEFDHNKLPLAWQWNHNPDNRFWSLTDRNGWLRLTTGRVDKSLVDARNTLTQRTFGPQSAAIISLDVSGMKDGDCAGLAALQKQYGFVGVKMEAGVKSLVMVRAAKDGEEEVARVALSQDVVQLKIECDFRNRIDEAKFFWSTDSETWTPIGANLKMVYTLPHFMGYRFAIFNFATKSSGGVVDVDHYRVMPAAPFR